MLALILVYGAYVAEVYRSGLESIHWSQTAAARSLGPRRYGQTMRYVVVPQAVRRIIPPLLNDFIGLQKDTALLSVVGVLEVAGPGPAHRQPACSTCHPSSAPASAFVLITIPLARFTDWLVQRDQARMRAGELMAFLEIDGVHKTLRRQPGAARHRPERATSTRWCASSAPSGCGKSTLLRCINALEPIDGGEIRRRRRAASAGAASTSTACARTSASSSRASTCSRT